MFNTTIKLCITIDVINSRYVMCYQGENFLASLLVNFTPFAASIVLKGENGWRFIY